MWLQCNRWQQFFLFSSLSCVYVSNRHWHIGFAGKQFNLCMSHECEKSNNYTIHIFFCLHVQNKGFREFIFLFVFFFSVFSSSVLSGRIKCASYSNVLAKWVNNKSNTERQFVQQWIVCAPFEVGRLICIGIKMHFE